MGHDLPYPLARAAPGACLVCGAPVGAAPGVAPAAPRRAGFPVCSALACRAVFEQGRTLPDPAFRIFLEHQARLRREEAVHAAQRLHKAAAEARENAAGFAAITARLGRASDAATVAVEVPTGRRRARPLPKRRLERYKAHLDAIIAEAAAPPPAPGLPEPVPQTGEPGSSLPGRLCGFCGGGCCINAGDAAHLSAQTMRRVMAADPGLRGPALRAAYLDRLPPRSVEGSCVNHTPGGCSLPRWLRSEVCNRYVCGALAAVESGLTDDPPARRVSVIQRPRVYRDREHLDRNNDIIGWGVLTEQGATRFRGTPPLSATVQSLGVAELNLAAPADAAPALDSNKDN